MPATCIVGLQWGDEAKGKVVDLLTPRHDLVVRYQGGANAGHTVVVGDQTYKLSLLPSGMLSADVQCIIAGGVVLDPAQIIKEIDGLRERGLEVDDNLLISDRAHVIFPWHMAEDRVMDAATGSGENIGTTQRGIGPCYRDKVGRSLAIRMGDMYRDNFRERIDHIVSEKRAALAGTNGAAEALDADAIFKTYSQYAARLKPHVADTTAVILDAVDQDKNILFEGAQGSLLDIDHGTFPYVTSSNSSGVGVCAAAGVPPKFINHTIGIVKAYSTRVGGGPFPTEQDNEFGQHLRDKGNEYGTVTRRPRRCGWFDAVAVRYTARLGGVDTVAIMLLDVLSGLDELKICTAYEIDGRRVSDFPSHVDDLRKAVPVYETLPGWSAEIDQVTDYDTLPAEAHAYLERVSELVGRPVEVVSVGPARAQTMVRDVELVG